MEATWEFGFAREDITAWEPGLAMMGWGEPGNVVEGVALPLHARAVVMRQGNVLAAIVVVELMMVTDAVRMGVLERLEQAHATLGLSLQNLVITATHTHSAPSGFSHYMWLNLAGPGYSDVVFQSTVDGIVAALVNAHAAMQPGKLYFNAATVDGTEQVAFNRAVASYNANADVEPVALNRPQDAVDRLMTAVRFEDESGKAVGMLNWFGVHCTSVHAENRLIHPDHKGVAANDFEDGGLVGLFCQEGAGDVSPNFRRSEARNKLIGRFDDDFASADHVGAVQCRYANDLMESASQHGTALTGPLRIVSCNVDFSEAPIDARWAAPGAPAHTHAARIGVSMAMGTAEGPGPLGSQPGVARVLNGAVRRIDKLRQSLSRKGRHDPKFPLLDLGKGLSGGRLLGTFSLSRMAIPNVHPIVSYIKGLVKKGAVSDQPWIAQVVSLQLVCLGSLAIAAMPFELTTVAARRLRKTLLEALSDAGITRVVLQPYSSSYVGYMTTFEEYQLQGYEGGYTLFGPWSLAALRTAFAGLAADLCAGRSPKAGPELLRFDPGEIAQRVFEEPWTH